MAVALPDGHPWRAKIAALDRYAPAATRYRCPSPVGRPFEPPTAERLNADIEELEALVEEARQLLKRDPAG